MIKLALLTDLVFEPGKLVRWLRRAVGLFGAIIVVVFASSPAFAHRSRSVITTINWNANSHALEIIHRVHGTDAEHALMARGVDIGSNGLDEPLEQAQFVLYIESQFELVGPEGVLDLEPVGVEASGLEYLVYQVLAADTPPSTLTVRDAIFQDAFNLQSNLVNITIGGRTRTLIFSGKDRTKTVRIEE